jgi:hypothetical protein
MSTLAAAIPDLNDLRFFAAVVEHGASRPPGARSACRNRA